jgi:hypothetical protein
MTKSTFLGFIERRRNILLLDLLVIAPFLILPLLIDLPYRVNIFLTWEGAYRLYLGQVPFKDFGLPMGYGFWVIPALFFKLFGPTFLSLIKAQVLINLLSVLSLRGILYNLRVKPILITLTLLVFCLTYVIYNFWPWYNHSVIVFELIALFFLTVDSSKLKKWQYHLSISASGFFTFFTFFTKQDVGGICFVMSLFILTYLAWRGNHYSIILTYLLSFTLTASLFILPVVDHNFAYWFNYGQEPHSSRISLISIVDIFLTQSLLEKIYLLLIGISAILGIASIKELVTQNQKFIIITLSVGLILQAIVTRVTSPLPTDHMNYFHTFAFIGIVAFISWTKWIEKFRYVILTAFILSITYSSGYWKYISGILKLKQDETSIVVVHSEPWEKGELASLKNILLPPETNAGIKTIMSLPFLKKENLKVLNLSELTFLAHEIGYTPLTQQPLWYHLNIGIFEAEIQEINKKVQDKQYDLVLFESIPSLNNFYPYAIQDKLKENYFHLSTFLAPRQLEDSTIDIFIHPDLAKQYGLIPDSDLTNNQEDQ